MATADAPAQAERFHRRSESDGPAAEIPLLSGGARRDPASYSVLDEPLSPDAPVDFRYLYDLVEICSVREQDRGKALDAKITSLLAGVVAFIGFSFRVQSTIWSAAAAISYLFPLAFLFSAFMTKLEIRAPSVQSLQRNFPSYPVTTLRDAITAMTSACAINKRINDVKAARLNVAAVLTALATVVVLAEQVVLDLVHP
jgi:hypothetical protein